MGGHKRAGYKFQRTVNELWYLLMLVMNRISYTCRDTVKQFPIPVGICRTPNTKPKLDFNIQQHKPADLINNASCHNKQTALSACLGFPSYHTRGGKLWAQTCKGTEQIALQENTRHCHTEVQWSLHSILLHFVARFYL